MKLIPKKKPRVIICGVDKIITEVNSWLEFLTEIGVDLERHKKIYGELQAGSVSWQEVKFKLFDILKDKTAKIHKKRFLKSIGQIEVSGDALSTIQALKKKGYRICIISGSIDIIVESIAKRLGIKDWYCNTKLIFDQDGYWTDIEYQQDEAKVKLKQAKQFMKDNGFSPEECLVVGHSKADIELFKIMPSVLMDSQDKKLEKLAWEEIEYCPRLLQILERFE